MIDPKTRRDLFVALRQRLIERNIAIHREAQEIASKRAQLDEFIKEAEAELDHDARMCRLLDEAAVAKK